MHSLPIKDIPLHNDGYIILIRRNNDIFVPHGDTNLLVGDILTIFGTNAAMEDYRVKFQ